MNLSRKIRDSIAKYDDSKCAEVLFRQDNCRPANCSPYARANCSDTCIADDDCTYTTKGCREPCPDTYCDRVVSETSIRTPIGSLHEVPYSATNCCRPYRKRCPSPSPCFHNPYRTPIRLRCCSPECGPRYSRCVDPCRDRCCDPCEDRFPRVCDSIILTKNRISRTRVGRRCEPRICPPNMCRSPCGRSRCRKPACNYRYPRNCVKPRVCCDGAPSYTRCGSPMRPCYDPCRPVRCPSPLRPPKFCPRPPRCDPCERPCPVKRVPFCDPRPRCPPPNCDSLKYPCFYYDKGCNNLCVKMVDGGPVPPCGPTGSNCCKPLSSLFCSGSGTMFSISPCGRDKCRGDYNYKINNLRSLSNIRSVIFNSDCEDRYRPLGRCLPKRPCSPCRPSAGPCPPCGPGAPPCPPCGPGAGGCPPCGPGAPICPPCGPGAGSCSPYGPGASGCSPCPPCGPGACPPCGPGACPPRSRPCTRGLDCNTFDYDCKPCPPRRLCTRVRSLCFNDCGYGSRRSCLNSCGRPRTCPTPITPNCNTCKCSGCTMFGPSYCLQRSNSRVPCLCAKYPCLPKFC